MSLFPGCRLEECYRDNLFGILTKSPYEWILDFLLPLGIGFSLILILLTLLKYIGNLKKENRSIIFSAIAFSPVLFFIWTILHNFLKSRNDLFLTTYMTIVMFLPLILFCCPMGLYWLRSSNFRERGYSSVAMSTIIALGVALNFEWLRELDGVFR